MNRRGFLMSLGSGVLGLVTIPYVKFIVPEPLIALDIEGTRSKFRFEDIEPILMKHIDPIIRRQFEDSATLYRRFLEK